MHVITPVDLPGNTHETDPEHPSKVLRSLYYRLSWCSVLERDSGWYDGLMEVFPEEHRPDHRIGLAGLESQGHSILWLGPAEIIDRFDADPVHCVPWDDFSDEGVRANGWPSSEAWRAYLPVTTWNQGGQGIVGEHPFADGPGSVVVYELHGRAAAGSAGVTVPAGASVPMVTYHCTRCHDHAANSDRFTSASPADRRLASRKARLHLLNCGGERAAASGDAMAATIASVMTGQPVNGPQGMYASLCQTSQLHPEGGHATSCAEIREARKFTAGRMPEQA